MENLLQNGGMSPLSYRITAAQRLAGVLATAPPTTLPKTLGFFLGCLGFTYLWRIRDSPFLLTLDLSDALVL